MNKLIFLALGLLLTSAPAFAQGAKKIFKQGVEYKLVEEYYEEIEAPSNFYIGIGWAAISGASADTQFSFAARNTPVLIAGRKISDNFALEVYTTINTPTSNIYKLNRASSASLVANLPLFGDFSVVGKIGYNRVELSRENNSVNSTINSSILHARGANYGVGFNYGNDKEIFIRLTYEQLADVRINNRDEYIRQILFSANLRL